MLLCLVKYSEKVDTISLVTMTHTIYFITWVYFKQYWMGIEHVHTTVLIRKKTKIKIHQLLLFWKSLYLVYCNVSRPLTLRNIEITLLYLIVHFFILYSRPICTKCPIGLHIRYFGKCLNYKNVTYSVSVFCVFNCLFKKMIEIDVLYLVSQFLGQEKIISIF